MVHNQFSLEEKPDRWFHVSKGITVDSPEMKIEKKRKEREKKAKIHLIKRIRMRKIKFINIYKFNVIF